MTYVILDNETGMFWNSREQRLSQSPTQFSSYESAWSKLKEIQNLRQFDNSNVDFTVEEF